MRDLIMRFLLSVLAISSSIAASPAYADWQYTRWGMSPEETAVASNGAVTVGFGKPLGGAKLGASGTYTSGQYRFSASFYYVDSRLSEVRLVLLSEDPANDNIKLRNSLEGQYGSPVYDSGFIVTFHDQTKNNRIDLMTIPGTGSRIIYRPLRDASSSGL